VMCGNPVVFTAVRTCSDHCACALLLL
jgi:hypothetical protein